MKFKRKIALVQLSVLSGMLFCQPVLAANNENAEDNILKVNDRVYVLDPDDFQYVAPGQTGKFETGFFRIGNVQPAGKIQFSSEKPDVLEINENGEWKAKQEGVVNIFVTWGYSDQTIDDLKKEDPDFELLDPAVPEYISMYVTSSNSVYRLYNPHSGEHFYTVNRQERKELSELGWKYEHISWLNAKDHSKPIYRLYNPNAGDHHYTTNVQEVDCLVSLGWENEGVSMFGGAETQIPVYRLYNPNAKAGSHHYTTDKNEYDALEKVGWKKEGIAFYSTSKDSLPPASLLDPIEPVE